MKEATGELNMTVITVVAIAGVGLLFTIFVWPNIKSNLMIQTACANLDANGNYNSAKGVANSAKDDGYVSCTGFVCKATYDGKEYEKSCK